MEVDEYEALKNAPKITACFVDLDNTLWNGVVAEGEKVVLLKNVYEILQKLYSKGIQVFAVSKNDKEDVYKTFEELGVKQELFTAIVSNWDPKYLNIETILRITEIRPETAIFVDDNIFELREVKERIPEIHIVEAQKANFISSVPAIESKKEQSSSEIQERINRYRTKINSENVKESFKENDLEFYRKLKREIQFGLVSPDNLDRVTRLLVETHRLNFNPGKFQDYNKALDYIHDCFNKGNLVYAVVTSEAGYSLGLTGVLIVEIEGNTAYISDGTFSCGIIGRDFEQKTILALIDELKSKGVEFLEIKLALNSTNRRLIKIFKELEFSEKNSLHNQESAVFHLNLKSYNTGNKFEWINISKNKPKFEYVGHPYIIKFFEENIKPLIVNESKITNLGSSRGEVIGLLEEEMRRKFYKFLEEKSATYTKIDMEYYPEEKNVVADAEDLGEVLEDESQDLVMAIELLEHTRHPWKVLNEMARICKNNGYIFISVPSFNYPKHEYPIDLWRFGPETLKNIFSSSNFEIVKLECEGDSKVPRRTMILAKKKAGKKEIEFPQNGKTDLERGLTIFP